MPELKELHVEFISLVRRPANRKKLVLKGVVGGGGTVREFQLIKADGHLRRVYGIVYAPDEVDAQGDRASKETIRKAAEEAQKPLREELETLKKAIASLNEALQKTDGRGATAGQPQSGEGETFV